MPCLYYSDLPHALVAQFTEHPHLVYGWRLVERCEDQGDCEYMNERWVVEDANLVADSYLAGKIVNPVFQKLTNGNMVLFTRNPA